MTAELRKLAEQASPGPWTQRVRFRQQSQRTARIGGGDSLAPYRCALSTRCAGRGGSRTRRGGDVSSALMATECATGHPDRECPTESTRIHMLFWEQSCIPEGCWGHVNRAGMCFRPPGTPIALPFPALRRVSFSGGQIESHEPSIDYDPGGEWAWHGFIINAEWVGVGETP